MKIKSTAQIREITLNDVWFGPKFNRNLFSVLAAQDRNGNSKFQSTATECKLVVNGQVVLKGARKVGGSLFKVAIELILSKKEREVQVAISDLSILNLYHARWGHQNNRHVKNMLDKVMGIKVKFDDRICERCIYGKTHQLPFGTREKATSPGELITTDIC